MKPIAFENFRPLNNLPWVHLRQDCNSFELLERVNILIRSDLEISRDFRNSKILTVTPMTVAVTV